MNIIEIGLVLYSVYIFRRILFAVFLWQLKEYRFDRMLSHLSTSSGRSLFLNPIEYFKWPICALSFFTLIYPFPFFLIATPMLFYTVTGFLSLINLFRHKWKIPVFTVKALGILEILISLLAINIYIYWFINGYSLGFLLLILFDLFILPITGVAVLLINIPSDIYKKYIAAKAKGKIERMKNLTVIGITGSIGKTSTKEFLSKILEAKYKVAKTPASVNTQIGIANFILKDLKDDAEIFVVEIGAYKKGEIKSICDMVHPNIGIITYIGTQHLELFGSQQKLISAKYELIKSLPDDGIAFFNQENEFCRQLAQTAEDEGRKVVLYGADKEKLKKFPSPNLLGKQTIPNLLAAIKVAEMLNVSTSQIRNQIKKMKPPHHTMELVGLYKGANLIDDTFNTSRESVLAALDYMADYKGAKVLILSSLIELGNELDRVKIEVNEKAKQVGARILIANKQSPQNAKQEIDSLMNKNSIIIFEGKEAVKYIKYLLDN